MEARGVTATLDRLESCPRTQEWAPYIRQQATTVKDTVQALRRFANLKPGSVADQCYARAAGLEARLRVLLNSLPLEV